MRHYAVVRSDKSKRAVLFREFEHGRLRQGWGWRDEQDLRRVHAKVRDREQLADFERSAWRNRRMLESAPGGLADGDVVVVPNLPEQGRWVIARLAGPYEFSPPAPDGEIGNDHRHVRPIVPVRRKDGGLAIVDPDNVAVDARLRATMRNLSRIWSIDALGPAVERIIAAAESGDDVSVIQPAAQKLEQFFDAFATPAKEAAWVEIRKRYRGAEFEHLVVDLLKGIYPNARIEHRGGPAEKGADVIVAFEDALGLEYKIAVQVKLHHGVDDDTLALEQIAIARKAHGVQAGVVITTATDTSDAFDERREKIEEELGIDVKVFTRDELLRWVMSRGAAQRSPPSGAGG